MIPQDDKVWFKTQADWGDWLAKNHQHEGAVWLKFAKKHSDKTSVSYEEAVQTALCYGWIDGQIKALDDDFYITKFTHRRPRSVWSKSNIERVKHLIATDRMQPSGLAEVEAAQADGRWQAAYDSPSQAEVPPDFKGALEQNPKASAFFETLSKSNRYAIYWRIHTLKRPETRQAKIKQFVDMLARGEKLH